MDAASLPADAQELLAELERRKALRSSLHPHQRIAAEDKSPLQAWQCSRRAGKTTCAMGSFMLDGLEHEWQEYAYVALTATQAKQIAWPILRKMRVQFCPGARMRESEMRVELPTGSAITLYGANRPDWMDRLYGQKLAKVWIDEAAFFAVDIEYLIEDILEPTLADLEGQLILMSRPGNVNYGYYYDVCKKVRTGWKIHMWEWSDNPAVSRQVAALIARKRANNPNIDNDPSFRRNWLNEWAEDKERRVYHYDQLSNSMDEYHPEPGDQYVLGIDLGWDHPTAFSVACWNPSRPYCIEVESEAHREMTIEKIASQVRYYLDVFGPNLQIVGDPDAKQAFEELRRRYDLPLQAASKSDKRYWIDQLNSDMLEGRVKIVTDANAAHVAEMAKLFWRRRPRGDSIEDPRLRNDLCDAFLYAFRHLFHFLWEEEVPPIEPGSDAAFAAEEAAMEGWAEEMYGEDE